MTKDPVDSAASLSNPFQFSLAWLLAYVTVMSLVLGGLVYGRMQALATYGTEQAKSDWEDWRAEAQQMAEGTGPVQRRVPKSAEPPALVLMRDYFPICVIGSLLLTTVLFGTFMVFVRGALGTQIKRE